MNINLYTCNTCNKTFTKKSKLERHEEICDKTEIEVNPGLQCDFCKKLFIKQSKLILHLKNVKGSCYKLRNSYENNFGNTINKNKQIINNYNKTINKTIIQNQNIYNNSIAIQPIVKPVIVLAKHGEETISHITKEKMLQILDIESFPEMCTELMRLLYFNSEVPGNRNWSIVYPRNKNAGVEFNHKTNQFERKSTYDIIDDKFSNMISLLFELVQEIEKEDLENNNLTKRQKINVTKYCMHFGQLDISKTSKDVYKAIHSMAYNSRTDQMKEWGENGHKGNHLSLKF